MRVTMVNFTFTCKYTTYGTGKFGLDEEHRLRGSLTISNPVKEAQEIAREFLSKNGYHTIVLFYEWDRNIDVSFSSYTPIIPNFVKEFEIYQRDPNDD